MNASGSTPDGTGPSPSAFPGPLSYSLGSIPRRSFVLGLPRVLVPVGRGPSETGLDSRRCSGNHLVSMTMVMLAPRSPANERKSCGPNLDLSVPLPTNVKIVNRTGGIAKSNSTRGVGSAASGEVRFGGGGRGFHLGAGRLPPHRSLINGSCRTKMI